MNYGVVTGRDRLAVDCLAKASGIDPVVGGRAKLGKKRKWYVRLTPSPSLHQAMLWLDNWFLKELDLIATYPFHTSLGLKFFKGPQKMLLQSKCRPFSLNCLYERIAVFPPGNYGQPKSAGNARGKADVGLGGSGPRRLVFVQWHQTIIFLLPSHLRLSPA